MPSISEISITRPASSCVPATSWIHQRRSFGQCQVLRGTDCYCYPSIGSFHISCGLKPHELLCQQRSPLPRRNPVSMKMFLKLVPTTRTMATRARPTIKAEQSMPSLGFGSFVWLSFRRTSEAGHRPTQHLAAGLATRVLRNRYE